MDWNAKLEGIFKDMASHGAASPATAQGFGALHQATMTAGVLDVKTKELLALACAISKQCDGCIGAHIKALKVAGGTRAEMIEAVDVCILMGGGPGYSYGLKAIEAWDSVSA